MYRIYNLYLIQLFPESLWQEEKYCYPCFTIGEWMWVEANGFSWVVCGKAEKWAWVSYGWSDLLFTGHWVIALLRNDLKQTTLLVIDILNIGISWQKFSLNLPHTQFEVIINLILHVKLSNLVIAISSITNFLYFRKMKHFFFPSTCGDQQLAVFKKISWLTISETYD